MIKYVYESKDEYMLIQAILADAGKGNFVQELINEISKEEDC